jgi:hypothetical protein
MGHWGSTTENYYAVGWVSAVYQGANDTNWRIYHSTGHIVNDSYQQYVNSTLSSSGTGGSQGPNGLTVGKIGYSTSEVSTGEVAFVLAYNRVLAAEEVLQNYNATKSRFKL